MKAISTVNVLSNNNQSDNRFFKQLTLTRLLTIVNQQNMLTNTNKIQRLTAKVAQGDIFMEQKMRFGLVLSWFWAGFGLVGNTEKKIEDNHEQFLRVFFYVFRDK